MNGRFQFLMMGRHVYGFLLPLQEKHMHAWTRRLAISVSMVLSLALGARAAQPVTQVPGGDQAAGLQMHPNAATRAVEMEPLLQAAWERHFLEIQNTPRNPKIQIGEVRDTWGAKRTHGFIWPEDRNPCDVIVRRTRVLLDDLERLGAKIHFAEYRRRLDELGAIVEPGSNPSGRWGGFSEEAGKAQRARFFQICRLQREIALANPLLNCSRMLFAGFANAANGSQLPFQLADASPATSTLDPKGGIYEVSNFGEPRALVRDLLANARVANGRYAGSLLSNADPRWRGEAVFNHFDLDYDAGRVVFAWAASGGSYTDLRYGMTVKSWHCGGAGRRNADSLFHLFTLSLNEPAVRQVTDGWYNDFQPCWLPDGDIAFISQRRHSMPRCGTPDACCTLHRVASDGSNLRTLSYHETDERFPCVDLDGSLIYSRWDYIDRPFALAHNLWYCSPDGCDPRAIHGNNPNAPVGSERCLRPIPGKAGMYMGIGNTHHQLNAGPLLIVNINIPDSNPGNFEYFWPDSRVADQGFVVRPRISGKPPAVVTAIPQRPSKGGQLFSDPMPLSEDYVLVAEGTEIYLVDSFRNRVLLFDAQGVLGRLVLRCPTPLRPRTRPPVIPPRYPVGPAVLDQPPATISVMNVYQKDYPWRQRKGYQDGREPVITHLRIVHLLCKTWPVSGGQDGPFIGWSDGGIPRMVLGTVPVEKDGSAYFLAPVNREIYFQALDKDGVAWKSMRSGTYVHPGEHLRCVGCHEVKHEGYTPRETTLALKRAPSPIAPDVGGVTPINYVSLVKSPVFDRKCLPCHQKEGKGIDFSYDKGYKTDSLRYTRGPSVAEKTARPSLHQYVAIAGASRGPFVDERDGRWGRVYEDIPRTQWNTGPWSGGGSMHERNGPSLGALGSALFDHLFPRHHNVKLTDEERRRVVLWLDCNALYGNGSSVFDNKYMEEEDRGISHYPVLDFDPYNPTGIQNAYSSLYQTPADKIIMFIVRDAQRLSPSQRQELFDDPAVVARIRGQTNAEAIAKCLADPIPQYRYEACRRLVALRASDQLAALRSALDKEVFPIVYAELVQAMNALSADHEGTRLFLRAVMQGKLARDPNAILVCERILDRATVGKIGRILLADSSVNDTEKTHLRELLAVSRISDAQP